MSGKSEISLTWEDVMNDLTDSYLIYGYNKVMALKEKALAANQGGRNWQNGIPKGRLLSETVAGDDEDRQRGRNRPSNASVEDSSTDSVNQIGSAIGGKAPQSRRQSVTGFITSFFKNKKQMKMETFRGTDEEKPAGSDSSEPHPTNLGLARIFPYKELMEATNGFKQQVGEGGFSSVYLGDPVSSPPRFDHKLEASNGSLILFS